MSERRYVEGVILGLFVTAAFVFACAGIANAVRELWLNLARALGGAG